MLSEIEFNKKLFRENFWFSPSWVIDTFNHYLRQYEQKHNDKVVGLKKLLEQRNSKKLKEMWATSVFLLGYQKLTNNQHWLQPCHDNAPDALGVCFVPHEKINGSDSQAQIFLEITEWDMHTKDDLLERIKNKLSNKSYPEYYHLVVHVTRIGDLSTDMDLVSEALIKINFKISGIWIIVASYKPETEDNYMVAELFPQKAKYEFSLSKELDEDRKVKVPPLLIINKEKGRGFYNFEYVELELPNL